MKACGCKGIVFGVESGNPEILKSINKRITISQVEEALRYAKEAGIENIEADFILGVHQNEKLEHIEDSINLIKKITPFIDVLGMSVGVPYPGTQFYRDLKEEGLMSENCNWNQFNIYPGNIVPWKLTYLENAYLVKLQRKLINKFYFRISYILKRITQEPSEILKYGKIALQYLKD